MEQTCVFCRIVAGEIPATPLCEGSRVLAFLDVGPACEGHALIIPRVHHATLLDCPRDLLGELLDTARQVAAAVMTVTGCGGFNLLCNNGAEAGQVVSHVHLHVIPRRAEDGVLRMWKAGTYPEGRLATLAEAIRRQLAS